MPQFAELVSLHPQALLLHCCVESQVWPHAPQLALSLVTSTQPVAQASWPVGQSQVPPAQAALPGQRWPQVPQLAESFDLLTQAPPQTS